MSVACCEGLRLFPQSQSQRVFWSYFCWFQFKGNIAGRKVTCKPLSGHRWLSVVSNVLRPILQQRCSTCFPFPRDSVLLNQTEALLYRSSMGHLYGDPIYMTSCKYGNSTGFKWKSFMDSSVLLPPFTSWKSTPSSVGGNFHDYLARC